MNHFVLWVALPCLLTASVLVLAADLTRSGMQPAQIADLESQILGADGTPLAKNATRPLEPKSSVQNLPVKGQNKLRPTADPKNESFWDRKWGGYAKSFLYRLGQSLAAEAMISAARNAAKPKSNNKPSNMFSNNQQMQPPAAKLSQKNKWTLL